MVSCRRGLYGTEALEPLERPRSGRSLPINAHASLSASLNSGSRAAVNAYAAAGWNFTDTSFETPGSCMVTPYIACADSMVFLECVMTMNWVCEDISRSRRVRRSMLASSSGASTSSRMQKGLGW